MERFRSRTCRDIRKGAKRQKMDVFCSTVLCGGTVIKDRHHAKTIRIGRDTIWITYEEDVKDKEPVTWAGVDMNSNNNTYAFPDGTIIRRDNDYTKQYNAVHSKICRVKRRSDKRIMGKYAGKAWRTYKNRIKDHTRKEAHWLASRGVGIGYEQLAIHKLYNKQNGMAPPTRGQMSTTLNVGQRKRARKRDRIQRTAA